MDADDLKALGDAYGDFANALVDWRAANPITDPTFSAQFDDMVASAVAKSNQLGATALTAALANLQTSIADLKTATQQAEHALTVIKDVTKVLAIGESVICVAAALLAPTVTLGTVAGELGGVAQAIAKANAPAPSPGTSPGTPAGG
jgi:hypothetical protein